MCCVWHQKMWLPYCLKNCSEIALYTTQFILSLKGNYKVGRIFCRVLWPYVFLLAAYTTGENIMVTSEEVGHDIAARD